MHIEVFGADDLKRARELASEARGLHLLPVPVVTWEAEIFDPSGRKIRHIVSKANSFTRNGLNLIAVQGGLVVPTGGTSFADGSTALKNPAGTVRTTSGYTNLPNNGTTAVSGETNISLLAGYGDTAEALDDYALVSEFGSGSSVNQLTKGTTYRNCAWVTSPKKFVTDIFRLFTNSYGSAQDIKEQALQIMVNYASSGNELMTIIRDVYATAITLAAGNSILLHYKIETAYS